MDLKYLDPWDFACSKLGDPEEGTKWHSWLRGKEPKIYRRLAHDMWRTLSQAENYFIHPSHDWTTPEQYDCKKRGWHTAVAQFGRDLNVFLDEIESVSDRVNYGLLSPSGFEHAVLYQEELEKSEVLAKNIIQTMAAYSIYCLDVTLAGLFEDEPDWAILTYAYSVTAMEMCRKYALLQDPDGASQKAARSSIGRKNAEVRHKETRDLEAEVIIYWKAIIDPTLSNEKAAILLRKVFPLSPRTLSAYVAKAKRESLAQSPN